MKIYLGVLCRLFKTFTQHPHRLPEQLDDKAIRQYAIDNGFIIVTKDADFYEMDLLYGQPPKIIWLKTGNQSKAATIKTLHDHVQAIEHALLISDHACIEIL